MIRLIVLSIFITLSSMYQWAHAVELEEGFIFLRVGQFKGNKFYRVLLTEDEVPYLNVSEILSDYFDMSNIRCEEELQYCEAILHPDKVKYWIDAKTRLYGNTDSINEMSIPKTGVVFEENQIWLRYDLFPNWMDVSAIWDLEKYFLSLSPKFKLLYERKEKLKIRRESALVQKLEHERIKKLRPIISNSNLTTHAKYSLKLNKPMYSELDESRIGADIQTKTDLNGGTLTLEGSASTDRNANHDSNTYWNYRALDKYGIHLIELGDTMVSRSPLLIPSSRFEHGLKFQRLKKGIPNGLYTIKGRAAKGSEVDITHNGLLIKSLVTGDSGEYEAKDIFVSGGDSITTHILHANGEEETIREKIANDRSVILPLNTFDFSLATGLTHEKTKKLYGNIRHGLFNNFTLGAHFLKDNRELSNGALIGDVAFKPTRTIQLFYEGSISETSGTRYSEDHSLALDISTLPYNFFQLKYFKMSDHSPLLTSTSLSSGITKQALHKLSYYNFLWESRFSKSKEEIIVSTSMTKVLSRKLNLQVYIEDSSNTHLNGVDELLTRAAYSPSLAHRLELSHTLVSQNKTTQFEYNYQARESKRPMSASLTISNSENFGTSILGNINFSLGKNVSVSTSTDGSRYGAKLAYHDAIAILGKSIDKQSQYGGGVIYGKVLPPKGTPPNTPMDGIIVMADRLSTTTDDNGNYTLKGVTPNRPVKVMIDPNSTDITMVHTDEFSLVQLRPTSNLKLDLKLSNSVGLDGVLYTTNKIPAGLTVQVRKISSGKIVKKATVEQDGFFLIENISTGAHQLELIGLPSGQQAPPPKQFNISSGQDWLSELRWEWD